MAKFSKRSEGALRGVHPDLVRVMREAIKDTPVDFTIISGVRTLEEQQALYAQGRTKPGAIVTNSDGVRFKSNHQVKADGYGHAIDLYPYVGGGLLVTQPTVPALLGQINVHIQHTAARLGVRIAWGGDWKMRDYPHFELKS